VESIWVWLNTPPTVGDVIDLFCMVYLAIFALGFLASVYLGGSGAERLAPNAIQRDGIRHWARVGQWNFGTGLFFFGVRALQINPLSFGEPIWLVGSLLALLVAAIRCVDWWRTTYRAQLEAHDPRDEIHAINTKNAPLVSERGVQDWPCTPCRS